jgi:hypothetical protein
MKRLLLLFATITLAGCARPGDYPVSPTCAWSEQDNHALNLARMSDRRHLRFDAATAEDMAIRWADIRFHLLPEYEHQRDQCMQTLFDGVAQQHGVDVSIVRRYSRERDPVADAAVIIGFSVVYVLMAYIFAGRVRRRFPGNDASFWIMTLIMAAGVSLVAVMVGNLGSIVVESVRLNSWHLSYRMNRIPFRRDWAMLFACGFVIFLLLALRRSRDKVPVVATTTGLNLR